MSGWDFRKKYEKEGRGPKEGEKTDPVNFSLATFGDHANFSDATFGDRANFFRATFGNSAHFFRATFGDHAEFQFATFGSGTNFISATFGDFAEFGLAVFGDSTYFRSANFGDFADFGLATFGDNAVFSGANFNGLGLFRSAKGRTRAFITKGRIKDKGNVLLEADTDRPGPAGLVFEGTKFKAEADFSSTDLSKTKFQHVALSNLSFLHSDISQTKFIACDWGEGYENKKFTGREPEKARWFRFRRPRLFKDELDWRKVVKQKKLILKDLKNDSIISSEKIPEGVDAKRFDLPQIESGDIEVLALQLKQSLEATRDPIAAGDFHFAAMEMQREQVLEKKQWARAAALWCYKMLNGYGERYGRALLWVMVIWLIFAVGYALLGGISLTDDKATGCLAGCGFWAGLGRAALYSLQNLLPFKFSSNFLTVSDTTVYLLSMFETLFGTTLFTFFVLALRRRFKR